MPDPWNMSSAQEQARFVETCALIRKEIRPHFDTLLEIGCGEGHQTEHLASLADHVTGIELSTTAVQRARRRLPAATFRAGDLMEQPWVNERGRFGLVTACEVIFHMKDMPGFLRAIDHLGRHCLVTYYLPLAEKWGVEAHVMKMPGVQRTTFRHGTAEWGAAWWKGAASRSPSG